MDFSEEHDPTVSVTAEAFERLLAHLAPEHEAAGYEYERLRIKLANYYRLKGLAAPLAVADLTLDRVARLIASKEVHDIGGFCFGVARLICLEQYRAEQRQRTAEQAFVQEVNQEANDAGDHGLDTLRKCLAGLGREERDLLKEYFADLAAKERLAHRIALARNEGISLDSLRLRIHRLRQKLERCLSEGRSN